MKEMNVTLASQCTWRVTSTEMMRLLRGEHSARAVGILLGSYTQPTVDGDFDLLVDPAIFRSMLTELDENLRRTRDTSIIHG